MASTELTTSSPAKMLRGVEVALAAVDKAMTFEEVGRHKTAAELAVVYGERMHDRRLFMRAMEYRERATLRAGEALLELKANGELGFQKAAALSKLGFSDEQAREAMRLAAHPREAVEALIKQYRGLDTWEAARRGLALIKRPHHEKEHPTARTPQERKAILTVRAVKKYLCKLQPDIIAAMPVEQCKELLGMRQQVAENLATLFELADERLAEAAKPVKRTRATRQRERSATV